MPSTLSAPPARFHVSPIPGERVACYVQDLRPVHPRADRIAYCEAPPRFARRAAALAPLANVNEVAGLAETRAKVAKRCRMLRQGWESPSRCLSSIPSPCEQRAILRGWIARQ